MLGVLVWASLVTDTPISRGVKAASVVHMLRNACKDFHLDVGRYPHALSELLDGKGIGNWDGPYLDPASVPNDPWGRPYHYVPPTTSGAEPDIFTWGADGRPGGTGADRDYHASDRH